MRTLARVEQELARWRDEQMSTSSLSIEAIDELESHLGEAMDQLVTTGLSAAEALLVAECRLGPATALESEFQKVGTLTSDRRLRWLLAGFVAAAVLPMAVRLTGRVFAFTGIAVGVSSEWLIAAAPLLAIGVLVVAAIWVLRLPSRRGPITDFIEGGCAPSTRQRSVVLGACAVVVASYVANMALSIGMTRVGGPEAVGYAMLGMQLLGLVLAAAVPVAAIVALGRRARPVSDA